jgi:hypothetical protein
MIRKKRGKRMFRLTIKTIILIALPVVLAVQGLSAEQAGKKKGISALGTKLAARLTNPDSSGLLKGAKSASDYLERRERFFYPQTRRDDPFNLPFNKEESGRAKEPGLGELELTGVLFSRDGRSVAILGMATSGGKQEGSKGGASFLVRVGDVVGGAEVIMIESKRIHLKVIEYGIVRNIVKELKPLVEERTNELSKPADDGGDQAGQSQADIDEYGGRPPPRR